MQGLQVPLSQHLSGQGPALFVVSPLNSFKCTRRRSNSGNSVDQGQDLQVILVLQIVLFQTVLSQNSSSEIMSPSSLKSEPTSVSGKRSIHSHRSKKSNGGSHHTHPNRSSQRPSISVMSSQPVIQRRNRFIIQHILMHILSSILTCSGTHEHIQPPDTPVCFTG